VPRGGNGREIAPALAWTGDLRNSQAVAWISQNMEQVPILSFCISFGVVKPRLGVQFELMSPAGFPFDSMSQRQPCPGDLMSDHITTPSGMLRQSIDFHELNPESI
jgi:hypothetical protein